MVVAPDARGEGKVRVAWDIAEGLLRKPLPQRWAHSQGVFRQAGMASAALEAADGEVLRQAAILHDVGYAPDLVSTGFHAVDGARYLRWIGLPETVVGLVAHHSCARVEADLLGLDVALGEFDPGPPELADCLAFCDMTTSPSGLAVTVEERLGEILERYGPGSLKARFVELAEGELRAATARVAARLAVPVGR